MDLIKQSNTQVVEGMHSKKPSEREWHLEINGTAERIARHVEIGLCEDGMMVVVVLVKCSVWNRSSINDPSPCLSEYKIGAMVVRERIGVGTEGITFSYRDHPFIIPNVDLTSTRLMGDHNPFRRL
jgi:hypothetical protein